MTQQDKAELFQRLHIAGKPVLLYNAWDAGSAVAVAAAGAPAIATGSWSVAAAQGHGDGEEIPLELVFTLIERITSSTDLPCSVDFEGGYSGEPSVVAENARRLIDCGVIGINFEDRIVGGEGLHTIDQQSARISAIRAVADEADLPFFINARTDLFLSAPPTEHSDLLHAAIERAHAYAVAGASGIFAPGLADANLIKEFCSAVSLPVNIMMWKTVPPIEELAKLGVARVSYGPAPYKKVMHDLAGTRSSALPVIVPEPVSGAALGFGRPATARFTFRA